MIRVKILSFVTILRALLKSFLILITIGLLFTGLSYIGKDIFHIPFCSDVIYVKDYYAEKIPYILKNISPADEVTLYDILDKELVDSFYADNGSFHILNGTDFRKTVNEGEGSLKLKTLLYAGYYTYLDKVIYIRDLGPLYEYTLTCAHEFGHYLSMERGYACDMEFYKIAEREMKQLKKAYSNVAISFEEYKAETFAYYILLPEMLKKAAPDTYEYHDVHYRELLNEETL